MLQILRKRAQSTFIQIIVVIIALVFIFWGVGSNLSGDRQAALVVNDEEISFQDFQQAYDRAYQRLSDQFGGNVPKGLAESFGIKQQVINQLIQTTLLKQGAREMGIHVSSEEIRQVIEKMVQFQDSGQFSMDRYKSVLSANRMAPTKFEHSMRVDRLSEIAVRDIGSFANVATDFEIQEIYSQLNEKVSVDYVVFSPENFENDVKFNDEELKTWFETVQDNYKTDPRIKLNYLFFGYEDVAEKIEVDQAKIEQYYQNNLDQYRTPEQRHARHILFKAEEADSEEIHKKQQEKAEEILKLAKAGEDFSELAKTHSEGPSKDNGGDLGFFQAGQMVGPFDSAVFSMQSGDISEVVKTRFGYHIILLEEIKAATTESLEQVKSEITKAIQRKESETMTFQIANDAYEKIIGAGSLTKYAEANPESEVLESEFFSRSDAPDEFINESTFLDKAFELNKGELSSLLKGNGGFAILYALNKEAPQVPSFDSVKDSAKSDYQKSKSKELAETAAKDLLSGLAEEVSFAELAEEKGLEVMNSGLISQNSQQNETDFPAGLTQAAFLLSLTAPLPQEIGVDGENFYVFTFKDRQIPTLDEALEEKEQYRDNLLQFKQQQLLAAWLRNKEMDAKITKHQSL